MEIPDLVRDRLGGENVQAGVNLGDENALCLTPSKTIVYTGEGLLSDESVSVFPHDVERLTVSEGRRKTKFEFDYVDGPRSFTVPSNRGEPVLELVLGGILRVADVAGHDESVEGVFRFSELTLIVTEARLVKLIGTAVWDEDYEELPFANVTGLSFEQGSVATQVVLAIEGRPDRIKAPNDKAPMVRRTLEEALYDYHDVESLEDLNRLLGSDDEEPDADADAGGPDGVGGFGLEDDIDPLVGGSAEEDDETVASGVDDAGEGLRPTSMDVDPTGSETGDGDAGEDGAEARGAGSAEGPSAAGGDPASATADAAAGAGSTTGTGRPASSSGSSTDPDSTAPTTDPSGDRRGESAGAGRTDADPTPQAVAAALPDDLAGQDDFEALEREVAELREAVAEQNRVLKKQHDAIERLIAERRSD
jgi:hypothetical protein